MKIKAIIKYHYAPVKLAKIKWFYIINFGEDEEKLELSETAGGAVN